MYANYSKVSASKNSSVFDFCATSLGVCRLSTAVKGLPLSVFLFWNSKTVFMFFSICSGLLSSMIASELFSAVDAA